MRCRWAKAFPLCASQADLPIIDKVELPKETGVEGRMTPEEDQAPDLFQILLDCYLSTLVALGDCAVQLCPEVGTSMQNRIVRLRRRLAFDASSQSLEQCRLAIETDLRDYAQQAGEHVRLPLDDARRAWSAAHRLADNLAARHEFYINRLLQFAAQMRDSPAASTPGQHQETSELDAAALKSCVDSMHRETTVLLAALRKGLDETRAQLATTEIEACSDAATGLLNRRQMERQIRAHCCSDDAPPLVVFVLNEYSVLETRYGGAVAGQVLREFGERLTARVRPQDTVGRWEDDELLVLFRYQGQDVEARAAQIAQWLEGLYIIPSAGAEWRIGVTATVRVIRPASGETAEDLIRRLDHPLAEGRELGDSVTQDL